MVVRVQVMLNWRTSSVYSFSGESNLGIVGWIYSFHFIFCKYEKRRVLFAKYTNKKIQNVYKNEMRQICRRHTFMFEHLTEFKLWGRQHHFDEIYVVLVQKNSDVLLICNGTYLGGIQFCLSLKEKTNFEGQIILLMGFMYYKFKNDKAKKKTSGFMSTRTLMVDMKNVEWVTNFSIWISRRPPQKLFRIPMTPQTQCQENERMKNNKTDIPFTITSTAILISKPSNSAAAVPL